MTWKHLHGGNFSAGSGSRRPVIRLAAAGTAVTAAVGLSLAGASAALAAPAQGLYSVACKVAALNTALGSAPSGSTLVLAKKCTYKTATPLTTVTTNLTIIGNSDTITLTGPGTILTVDGANVSLSHLTFTGGAGLTADAGAIQNDGGTLTVTDATFTDNGGEYGGAINNDGGTLLVTDSNFTDNGADAGGAIADFAAATTTVNGGSFYDNDSYTGGAIANVSGSLTINASGSTQQTAFEDNYATPGGSVIRRWTGRAAVNARRAVARMSKTASRPDSRPDHSFATVRSGGIRPDTTLYDGYGGAIVNYVGTITVNNGAFSYNDADDEGGSIASQGATSTVTNSGFTDGGGFYGGAVYVYETTLNLVKDSISDNDGYYGGGIYLEDATSTLTQTGVFGNTADYTNYGGGIYVDCDSTLNLDSKSFVTQNSPNNITYEGC
jgi:hypothetical protein